MSKQYHFVVMYDTKTKSWSIAPDVSVNFEEGDVWDEKTQKWSFNTGESDKENAIINAIGQAMIDLPPV